MPNISAVIGMPVNASAGLFNNNRNRFGLSFRPVERMATFSERFIDHIFANKEEGFHYVASLPDFSDGNMSRPMPSAWAGILGWDVEIYCSGKDNILDGTGTYFQSR